MGRSKQPSSALASKYFCSIPNCSETFTRLAGLRRHTLNVHETPKKPPDPKYECEICEKLFRKRKQLYDHKFVVHNEARKEKFACQRCSAKFASVGALAAHTKRHDGYECAECQFRADTWSLLRKHKANQHPNVFPCDQCDKKFSKPHALRKHQRLHQKLVKCPDETCTMMLLPRNITKHVKTTHSNSLPDGRQLQQIDDIIAMVLRNDPPVTPRTFECVECGKKFAKERNLRLHNRNLHSDDGDDSKSTPRIPTFACTVADCPRRFQTEEKLRAHSHWHRGVRPHACPQNGCSARFAGRSALQRHVKWKHMKMLQQYRLIEQLATTMGQGGEGEQMEESTSDDGEETESQDYDDS